MDEEHRIASEARKPFADGLRIVRHHYGIDSGQGTISQEDFAKMLGIGGDRPGERYGHYERATREPPIWLLAAIRRVTGYSLDDLIAQLPPGRRLPRDPTADVKPPRRDPPRGCVTRLPVRRTG